MDLQKATNDDVNQANPTQAKLKLMGSFRPLRKKADEAANAARESYAKHFSTHVRQHSVFCIGDLVYIDSPSAFKATEGIIPDNDPSRKLRLIEGSPYTAITVRDHTLTVHVYEIHNVVSIDKVVRTEMCE